MKLKSNTTLTFDWKKFAKSISLFTTILLCTLVPARAEVYLKVGFLSEPEHLNPFRATDAWTNKVLRLIHQPLYRIDPASQKLIPWLAADQPIYDPKKMTVTFHLVKMQWDDGMEFNAEDVVFTAEIFKKFQFPRYSAYWEFVKKIEAIDERTVQITLERPMAVLFTRILTTWIVQKRKWEPIVREANDRLKEVRDSGNAKSKMGGNEIESALKEARRIIQAHTVKRLTGLGPFKFIEWKKGRYIRLVKNDRFFGQGKTIEGRRLGPYIDGIMFKVYDGLAQATLALRNGVIDFLWKGVSQGLVEDLIQNPNIQVSMSMDSGYRYLGLNLHKAPMSDSSFRRALSYLIDKDFIVKRILHSHGEELDSVVPPWNNFYFNPNTPAYGQGMDRDKRIREAYRILAKSGYRWKKPPIDHGGSIQIAQGLIMPNGNEMPPLTILTPTADYDTEMAFSGRVIQGWLQEFGITVLWKPMIFGRLIKKIRDERDFDMFVLGWRSLSVDPDYLRRFFHSGYIPPNGRNYTGYSNSEFDRLADLQTETMDRQARRKIVIDLQSQLMADLPYIPLYVPHRMEGFRTDRFEGWTIRLGGVGNIWSFCLLKAIQK